MQRLLMVRIVHNGDVTNLAPQDNNSRTQIASPEPAGRVQSLESIIKGGRIRRGRCCEWAYLPIF